MIQRHYMIGLFCLVFWPMPLAFSDVVHYLTTSVAVLLFGLYLSLVNKFNINASVLFIWGLLVIIGCTSLWLNVENVDEKLVILRELYKITVFPLFLYFSFHSAFKQKSQVKAVNVETWIRMMIILQIIVMVLTINDSSAVIVNALFDTTKNAPGVNFISEKVRYTGTFENPNYFGLFLVMLLSWYCSKDRVGSYEISMIVILGLLVILTGSRTAIFAFIPLIAIRFYKNIWVWLFIGFVALLFGENIIAILESVQRFSSLLSIDGIVEIPAVKERWVLLERALVLFYDRPFFGYFESPIGITDNLFTLLLLRYGLLFCLVILLYTVVVLFIHRHQYYLFKLIYPVVAIGIFSLAGGFLDNPRMYSVVVLIIGVSISRVSVSKSYCGKKPIKEI